MTDGTLLRTRIGIRLRRLRHAQPGRGDQPLAQTAAAEAAGITQASLSNYETGKREVPLDTALRLAQRYRVEITDIASVEDLE